MFRKTWKCVVVVALFLFLLTLVGCHEHLYGEWTVTVKPSCSACGSQSRYCECGEVEIQEIAPVAHTFGSWVITTASSCTEQGRAERACTVCGAVESKALELDPANHRYGEWSEATAPGCLEAGERKRTCACGAFETGVIPMLGHDVIIVPEKAPTVTETGLTEGSYCDRCKEVLTAQELLDKVAVRALSEVRYQGDTTGALIFYWDVDENYADLLEKICITVQGADVESSFELAPDAECWEYLVVGEQANYVFTFTPVLTDAQLRVAPVKAQFFWAPQLLELSFPRLEITTEGGELPTFDRVSAPAGCWGAGITNAEYVQSVISLYDGNDTLLYSTAEKGFDGAKIKVRGNTSAYARKTPFKIKLDKKADLLADLVDREENVDYRDKNWVLLAGGNSLNTAVGFEIGEIIGMDWTPAYAYVALFVNGEYRGVYILAEGVEQSEARCDVSDEGYVIEMDAYWWNEDMHFTTPLSESSPTKYTFKYPDAEDFDETSQRYTYIKQYMTDLENALISGGDVSQYMDLQTFAKWLLAHDILATYDSGGSNIYLTKYDNTEESTVRMGLLWDFDSICWNLELSVVDQLSRIRQESFFYMPYLLQNEQFMEIYADEYAAVRDQVVTALESVLAQFDDDSYRALVLAEDQRWGTDHANTVADAEAFLAWFEAHLAWMDENAI